MTFSGELFSRANTLHKCFRPAQVKILKELKDKACSGHSGVSELLQVTVPHLSKGFIAERGVLKKPKQHKMNRN